MCPVWLRLVSLVPLVLTACPTDPPAQETTSDDTTTSQTTTPTNTTEDCQIGMEGCPCTGGGACDPGLECNDDNKCVPVAGVTTETVTSEPPMTTTTTSDTTDGDDTSTGTTEPVGPECTPPGDGTESAECMAKDPNKPFCVVDTCQPCGELAPDACIEATDGARPICMPAGSCVQCDSKTALEDFQCEGATPHCNLETHTCEGCFEHSECPTTACDVAARKCFPKGNDLWIRQGTGMCSDKPEMGGTMMVPFCDFQTAVAAAQLTGENYTFHLMGNIDDISPGAVQVTNQGPPVSYAFVHEPGGPGDVHTQFVGQGPLIVVGSNVKLYIVNFAILPTGLIDTSRGIDCQEGGEVWLDDSRVTGARGPGIRGNFCDIHLRRSAVSHGKTEGIDMTGGSLFAVNSFITKNAFVAKAGGGGLVMRMGATADISFTTIAENRNEPGLGRGDSIQCDDEVSIKIRNSIIARDPASGNVSVVCGTGDPPVEWIDADFNVVDTELGGNNEKKAAEDVLDALLGNSSGIYRIDTSKAWEPLFDGKAEWQLGDPHCDFEWEPRNAMVKAKNIAGADTVPP